jgi:Fe-S cluster biogenesis protein NfuA
MTKNEEIEQKVELALSEIRPYLELDGGNVAFIRFEEDTGVVELELTGRCKDCPMSNMTLRAGIERLLLNRIPDIRRIEAVAAKK